MWILLLLLTLTSVTSAARSEHLEQNALALGQNRFQLEFDFPEPEVLHEESGVRLRMAELGLLGEVGQPDIPALLRMLEIPPCTALDVTVLEEQWAPLGTMTLLAFSADENDSAICSESESTVLPEEWFRLETPARLRDTWLARLCIVPVRWNAETGEVHYLQHASLQVQPAELLTPQVPFAFSPENPDRHRALAMEASFLKQTLGSSQMISLKESPQGSEHGLISTQWEATPYPPNYLVVANQDAQNQLALQEWLAWKRQKGHHVTLVSENETAFTYSAIRERILDEYLNSPYPPYYVLLVGDVTGPYAIPAQYPTYDHGYVCLLGNDVMADFAIGRVSVETATSLATVFNKIVAYERNPFVESTDWMQRASFITGSNHCGISMSQLCRSVAFQLVGEKGYTQVDTVFCGPSPAYVYDWYNQGISFHTYRGWFGRRGLIQP